MAPLLLLGAIFVLDAVWSGTLAGSGSLLNGIFDDPAHLATCAICLLALAAILGRAPEDAFVAAALVGSTAIDLDHIPGFLGSHAFTEGTSRPYCHSLWTPPLTARVYVCVPGQEGNRFAVRSRDPRSPRRGGRSS